jgi:hypothetical protein
MKNVVEMFMKTKLLQANWIIIKINWLNRPCDLCTAFKKASLWKTEKLWENHDYTIVKGYEM